MNEKDYITLETCCKTNVNMYGRKRVLTYFKMKIIFILFSVSGESEHRSHDEYSLPEIKTRPAKISGVSCLH